MTCKKQSPGKPCCCSCMPLEKVPITTIPGTTDGGLPWVQEAGMVRCCWAKWYTYTGARPSSSAYQTVYHERYDGDISWDWYGAEWTAYCFIAQCNYFVPIAQVRTQYKLERWLRLKMTLTAVVDPVTGKDIKITWSKVCGSSCDGGPAADYWVVEYEQKFTATLQEEQKVWTATQYNYTNLVPACQPTVYYCSPYYEGKWFGGTFGGTYYDNQSSPPAIEDIWTLNRNIPGSWTVNVKRYKSFDSLPASATLYDILASEIIPLCKQTPCMLDVADDGEITISYGADYPRHYEADLTWSIVTDSTEYFCQAFTACSDGYMGFPSSIRDQYGNGTSSVYCIELADAACAAPQPVSGPYGCMYKVYTAVSSVFINDIYGSGTFTASPPASITVMAAP